MISKPLDKIIIVVAYKNDVTREVGEDTLILNVWNDFCDSNGFLREIDKVVDAIRIMKNFSKAKICSVTFSRTERLQGDIKCIQKELAEMDGDKSATFENWDQCFFPNGKYIGPFGG